MPGLGRWLLNCYYRNERALIDGRHTAHNQHRSIIHFTVNKSASQYVKKILSLCASHHGMTPIRLNDYAFNSEFPFIDRLTKTQMEEYVYLFKNKGYLYSPFGGMIDGLPRLDDYHIIFMVRDPRDVLVSQYFSTAYSHKKPSRESNKYHYFMNRRDDARKLAIDEFVVQRSDPLLEIYEKYRTGLLHDYPRTYLTRFEDMVADFSAWLDGLLDYCELPVETDMYDNLIRRNEALKPKEENPAREMRKGQHGDFAAKLSPQTIDLLNEKFSASLEAFGYLGMTAKR